MSPIRSSLVVVAALVSACPVAAEPSSFDGDWLVNLACPATPDGRTLGYAFQFPASVREGVLHGERGVKDHPGWLSLDGRIGTDGQADLVAEGRTNLPAYAVDNIPQGRAFRHAVRASFEPRRGTGSWTTIRTCTFSFERR